eukprot:scaffold8535_cov132-Cylindrotheca_fusiformis.AAC.12
MRQRNLQLERSTATSLSTAATQTTGTRQDCFTVASTTFCFLCIQRDVPWIELSMLEADVCVGLVILVASAVLNKDTF